MRLLGKISFSLLGGVVLFFNFFLPGDVFAAPTTTHIVNPGESLYLISQWYGFSVENIKQANGLTSDIIYPGQTLSIPLTQSNWNNTYYTVRQGDTLFLIGSRFGVSYSDLQMVNGLGSTLIYPGQTLIIPSPNAAQVSRGGMLIGRVPYTRTDFDLLARLITAEADSESFLTKVAVGAVVLNRVLNPLFPNTIPEVIYQIDEVGAYQFEPVLNGWINVAPNEDARRAAQLVLNGADPTGGALFFFESWVPNKFLQSRPGKKILDSFTFTD
jgi:LysM repeat protein